MLTRRELLGSALAYGLAPTLVADEKTPIIDAHTHFYDPTRPQGVPWPSKDDPVLYRKVLPPEYVKLADPLGVTGTVVVEASPWVEDNQWLLDLAKDHPIILGVVGRLLPSDADFDKHLKRFAKNPKFRGIRITHDEVKAALETPKQLDRLKSLTDFGLTLDVNGGPELLADTARLAEKLEKLPIVVNHLANPLIDGKEPPKVWTDGMKAVSERPNVWCKLSGLVDSTRKKNREAPTELKFYLPVLEVAWKCFGSERLMFGSNWPVSENFSRYEMLVQVFRSYILTKGQESSQSVMSNPSLFYRLKSCEAN